MSNKNLGKSIRTLLKENGYSNRLISVRVQPAGYSTSIRVTIKDLSIPIDKILTLVTPFKSIAYCEVTQEVLEGGNTYLNVDYDYDILMDKQEELLPKAQKLWQYVLAFSTHSVIKIAETTDHNIHVIPPVHTGEPFGMIMLTYKEANKYDKDRRRSCYGPEGLAEFLATFASQFTTNYVDV